MKNAYKQKRQNGFTIIEVMIVLAVAALILLIVLLAVPALQRNSRNTTLKNDVSTLAGAISTYESDNNGTGPTNIAGTGQAVNLSAGTCAATSDTSAPYETAKLNGSTTVVCQTAAPTTATTSEIFVVPKQTCGGGASARAYSLYYYIETSGSPTQECSDT